MAYTWEFFGGLILDQFSARTWDYSLYKYDVMGLIALEYAPLWFFSGVLQEFVYEYLLSLSLPPSARKKEGIEKMSQEINGNLKIE